MDPFLTLMQIAGLVVGGMCHALLGSIKVPLAGKLQIDEAKVGGLVGIFGFTLIPTVLAAGFLVDALGQKAVLTGGLALLTVSLVLLSQARSYPVALVAVLLLGIGWSALVNVLNVTSPPAFLPLEKTARHMAYAMNLGDFIFGMGAFATPLLIAALVPRIRLERTLLVPAAITILPLVLAYGVDWGRLIVTHEQTVSGGLGVLLSDPIVWLCCAAFFCHVPIEASVAAWATTLMTGRGVSEATAATLLSVFWLTFTGSRLLTALLLPAGADTILVAAMAGLCIAFTVGLALSRSASLTCGLVVAAGLILGPIFPTLIAILMSHVTPSLHGRVVGIFFCIGGIGWTAIPILIGAYAKRTNVQRAFLIATLCAVLLTGLSLALHGALAGRHGSPGG
ncbi:MAG TPA: MFS transporter [Pirellulaceae bacterium]|nr:MFS transporter [Pirellulaceae bacterium]